MIPFLDLQKINARFNAEFNREFQRFLDSGYYILGNSVQQFEMEYASYCNAKYAVGVANGLDALRLILEGYKTLGKLSENDEVLVASNTYIATILAIIQTGLKPILVEAEKDTYGFDIDALKAAITPKTKAVMPVHLYGQITHMDVVLDIAKKNNLLVIEDAAQSHGAVYNPTETMAERTLAYSFYPTKNLGALGDGGAVVTNNYRLSEIIRKLRNYGTSSKYINDYVGFNSRLDEIQAALLSIKLKCLDADNNRRREIARKYLSEIKNPKIILPKVPDFEAHVFHLFVVRTPQRDLFQNYLSNNEIETLIHYPIPPHRQEALKAYNHLSFPITEEIHNTIISIPISPVMTDEEVQKVIEAINRY